MYLLFLLQMTGADHPFLAVATTTQAIPPFACCGDTCSTDKDCSCRCSHCCVLGDINVCCLPPEAQPATTTVNVTAITTFFGSKDNCPPGGAIAYPSSKPGRHLSAGGVGTASDPVTFAGTNLREAPGTIIYVPHFAKYFVMEDDCEECDRQWKHGKKRHYDLWMGPDAPPPGPGLVACENALTSMRRQVIVNPPLDLPVRVKPLFANNTCVEPAPPCHDVGAQCGNECEIPARNTCDGLEELFSLTPQRFRALNPGLDCSKEVAAGTSVCMGGTCGD